MNVTLTYHNVIMGVKQDLYLNHAAINTIIMAVKKRICYKERLKCYNPNTIRGIIEGRISTEKYIEKKNGGKTNKWDVRTALKNTLSIYLLSHNQTPYSICMYSYSKYTT